MLRVFIPLFHNACKLEVFGCLQGFRSFGNLIGAPRYARGARVGRFAREQERFWKRALTLPFRGMVAWAVLVIGMTPAIMLVAGQSIEAAVGDQSSLVGCAGVRGVRCHGVYLLRNLSHIRSCRSGNRDDCCDCYCDCAYPDDVRTVSHNV
jgi:hypothetical protein